MSFAHKIIVSLLCFVCFQTANAQWQKVNLGSFSWLHSVYFTNASKGWIVGGRGTYYETNDGGKTWKNIKSITQDTIRDVYFSDNEHGWLLCEKDVFTSGSTTPSYILETSDGGKTWKNSSLQDAGDERLVKLFFSKDGFGRAVGEKGTIYLMQPDKSTWKKISLPVRFLLLDGSFFNQNSGVVVGGGGSALFTDDQGKSWNTANFSNRSNGKLNSVFFINQTTGWAVGADGKIFATINGGKFWREQNSNIKKDLLDVYFVNSAEGWAIGDGGTILHTTTGGNIWKPIQTIARHKLERAHFIGKTGWVVGFGGTILKFDPASQEKVLPKPAPILQKRTYSAER